jgi:hypothetical protein
VLKQLSTAISSRLLILLIPEHEHGKMLFGGEVSSLLNMNIIKEPGNAPYFMQVIAVQ